MKLHVHIRTRDNIAWKKHLDDRRNEYYRAETAKGWLTIRVVLGAWSLYRGGYRLGEYSTLEEAKRAAEEDAAK